LEVTRLHPEHPAHLVGRDLALVDKAVQRPLRDTEALRGFRGAQPLGFGDHERSIPLLVTSDDLSVPLPSNGLRLRARRHAAGAAGDAGAAGAVTGCAEPMAVHVNDTVVPAPSAEWYMSDWTHPPATAAVPVTTLAAVAPGTSAAAPAPVTENV